MEQRMYSTTSIQTASARNKVLRNTYALLALSLLPTAVGAWLGVQANLAAVFAGSPLMSVVGFFVVSFAFFFGIERFKNSSTGVFLLLAFTFFMGLWLSNILQHTLRFGNGASLIAMAAGGTAIAFFGLSAVASSTKRDLSNMGKFLFVGTLLILAAGLANIFFQIPALTLTVLVLICAISCVWLVYDINRVVTGGETNYVTATLAIYIDLYNIFQSLLSLLGIFGGDRE